MSRDLAPLALSALSDATKAGADAGEVLISCGESLDVEARQGDVETVETGGGQDFAVTVYFGQRKGSAHSSGLTEESIAQSVATACAIAKQTAEDPCAGLAPAELMATEFPDLDCDRPWKIGVREAIEKAVAVEKAMFADPAITNSEGASVSRSRNVGVYANTHGFVGEYADTLHDISAIAVAGKGAQMQRDHWSSVHRHPDGLETPEAVGKKAAQRAAQRLGARKPATRNMPVAMIPEIARGFIGHFVAAISGGNIYRNASFMCERLGETCFPPFVRLIERPYLPGAIGSASFDAEGVATPKERVFVDGGVAHHYALGSYSARKLGMQTTANAGGVHNLCLETDDSEPPLPFAELLERMGEGFLVTEFIGAGVNLVTGDYSRGAVGFMVENGRIAYPVEEVAVAGNLKTMFQSIRAVGDDVDTRGAIRSGSILLGDVTVAGE